MIAQMHFEFRDWEEAFKTFYHYEEFENGNLVLIVSEHWASSGYWIEKEPKFLPPTDHVYKGKQVRRLESRIKNAHQNAKQNESSVCGLIL